MKSSLLFGILIGMVIILGTFSLVEVHPHASMDIMKSHSHDPNVANFQEEFILHDFEHVILSTLNFIKDILFV